MNVPIIGLVFIFIVLFTLFTFALAFPLILNVIYGACWANALQTAETIRSGLNTAGLSGKEVKEEITLGDCVGDILFVNKEDLLKIKDLLDVECPEDSNGFIIVRPFFKETKSYYGLKVLDIPEDVYEDIVKLWKEKVRQIRPKCYGLICETCSFGDVAALEGPLEEGKTKGYCVEMSKSGPDAYRVEGKEGSC